MISIALFLTPASNIWIDCFGKLVQNNNNTIASAVQSIYVIVFFRNWTQTLPNFKAQVSSGRLVSILVSSLQKLTVRKAQLLCHASIDMV